MSANSCIGTANELGTRQKNKHNNITVEQEEDLLYDELSKLRHIRPWPPLLKPALAIDEKEIH
jgi:hypothetical protein